MASQLSSCINTLIKMQPNHIIDNKRDRRLDTMRGILLIMMTLNHLGGELKILTAQPFGYVTAAEGFILLSAYTYAITSRLADASFHSLTLTACKRAGKIYKYHILAFLILLSIAVMFPVYQEYFGKRFFVNNDSSELLKTSIGILLLVHQPVYFDILPMYFLFVLASPLVLYALQRQQGVFVILGSVVLWMVGHYVDPVRIAADALGMPGSDGYFNPLSWQILWVAGLYIGFAHKHQKKVNLYGAKWQLILAISIGVVLLLSRHSFIDLPDMLRPYFGKANLGLLRIVNVAAQLVILFALLRVIHRNNGLPWLKFIGTYSL